MFKIGTRLNYGFYSNLKIVGETDKEFVLEDCSGNRKKVYKYLVETHGQEILENGAVLKKVNDTQVLLKDNTIFELKQLTKNNISVKRLISLLYVELIWERDKSQNLDDLIMSNIDPYLMKNQRQFSLCKVLLCQTNEPRNSLLKAIRYFGLPDDEVLLQVTNCIIFS